MRVEGCVDCSHTVPYPIFTLPGSPEALLLIVETHLHLHLEGRSVGAVVRALRQRPPQLTQLPVSFLGGADVAANCMA